MALLGHESPTGALRYQHAAAHRDLAVADSMGGLIVEIRAARTDTPTEQAELGLKWRARQLRVGTSPVSPACQLIASELDFDLVSEDRLET
jgi:hypothetical protein